jgi:hypothetical protein
MLLMEVLEGVDPREQATAAALAKLSWQQFVTGMVGWPDLVDSWHLLGKLTAMVTAMVVVVVFCDRLSALITALDIVFASCRPLWVDKVRGTTGPPAHRGYRMYVHRPEAKAGPQGKVCYMTC